MPLASCIAYVKGLLDDIGMPAGLPSLAAYTLAGAPDPDVESSVPTCVILSANGPEKRLTVPRNTGPNTPAGFKTIKHQIRVLVWFFMASNDPDADTLFGGIMDGIMASLRTCAAPANLTDPWTGTLTQMVNAGEEMTYDQLPARATKNQRLLLCEGVINVPVLEQIQA